MPRTMIRMGILTGILTGVVLTLAGPAMGEIDLEGVRDEIADLRKDLPTRVLDNPRAAVLASEATEWLVDAIAIIDEGDEDRTIRMFGRLSRALRLMKKAARTENSAAFEDYVAARGERLWIAASSLFAPENPAIVDPNQSPLQKRLSRKMSRAGRRAVAGKHAAALSRLRPAWRALLKLDRIP